ncbi:MAG: family transporter protein [Verrucomicrobiales bacterium]|nr:family transporter protein [Verrucomicrobiales bacterium]
MTFLPIVDRELRVRARLKSTYRFRIVGALLAIGIVVFLLITSPAFSNPGRVGKTMFTVLAWLVFPYCLFEGTRNTADCLSEEKRGGTLGLLFLTDLKPYDVVLGKLVATSLNSFYGFLAVLPPLAVPLLLGGVTAGEFWRLTIVLAVTLFFSLTAGMFTSSVSYHERRAWGGTVGIIGFCAVMLPLFNANNFGYHLWLFHFSPTVAFFQVREATYLANPGEFWLCVSSLFGLSWIFLLAAGFILPRTWQDSATFTPDKAPEWFERLVGRFTKGGEKQRTTELLAINPVLWLAGRNSRQYFFLWVIVVAAGVSGVAGWAFTRGDASATLGILIGGVVLNYIIVAWVASQACSFFPEARASGAMEQMLSTPLKVKTILDGYTMALKKQFLGPAAFLLGAEALILTCQVLLLASSGSQGVAATGITIVGGVMALLFILDLTAAAYYGMWMGLSSRTTSKAMTKTTLYVLVLPLICVPCCYFLWPIVGIVKNLIFINYAQDQMRRYFRVYVTERFSSGTEFGSWSPLPPPPKPSHPLPPVIRPS